MSDIEDNWEDLANVEVEEIKVIRDEQVNAFEKQSENIQTNQEQEQEKPTHEKKNETGTYGKQKKQKKIVVHNPDVFNIPDAKSKLTSDQISRLVDEKNINDLFKDISPDLKNNLNEFQLNNSLEFIMYAKYICQKFKNSENSNISLFLQTLIQRLSQDKFESTELKEIDKKLQILQTEKQIEEKNQNKKKDKRPKLIMDRDITKPIDDDSEEEETNPQTTKKPKKKKQQQVVQQKAEEEQKEDKIDLNQQAKLLVDGLLYEEQKDFSILGGILGEKFSEENFLKTYITNFIFEMLTYIKENKYNLLELQELDKKLKQNIVDKQNEEKKGKNKGQAKKQNVIIEKNIKQQVEQEQADDDSDGFM